MRAISLFTGVAGFELGFAPQGIETVLQNDIDKWCQRVLRYRHPTTPLIPDVCDIRDSALKDIGPIGFVYGGFPCQDASLAGLRKGLAGERTGLWWEFHRILREKRPRWVMGENVYGLLTVNGGHDFKEVTDSLVELGYGVAYRVLDSQFFGVPQRRRRVYVVGCLGDVRRAATVLDVFGGLCGRSSAGRGPWQGLAASPEDRARRDGQLAAFGGNRTSGELDVTTTLTASASASGRMDFASETFIVAPWDERNVTSAANRTRPEFGLPMGTLHTEKGQGVVIRDDNGSRVRRLTVHERERLMGWPDDWTRWGIDEKGRTVEVPESQRTHMTGNGGVANVLAWIGQRMVAVDRQMSSVGAA